MRTRRPLTPFERAIDRAIGFRRKTDDAPIMVTMSCAACGKGRSVAAFEAWPDGTVKVEWERCPTCAPPDGGSIRYLDVEGKELAP
jgi:hypothetical protein